MDVRPALKSQYHATLNTLRLAIEQCPDAMWNDPADGYATFWRVSYHVLLVTHLYLADDEHSFTPWARHRQDASELGPISWQNNRLPAPCTPYTRADMLEYWKDVDDMVDQRIDAMNLDAPECGFPWYPMSKFEHQLVNLRHVQHHAAILSSRLRRAANVAVKWVGKG